MKRDAWERAGYSKIVCCFFDKETANQFVKCLHIRRKDALSIYRTLKQKNIHNVFCNSKSANDFVRKIRLRRQRALRLYRALKTCKLFELIHLAGVSIDTENRDCYVIYDMNYFIKRENSDKIREIAENYVQESAYLFVKPDSRVKGVEIDEEYTDLCKVNFIKLIKPEYVECIFQQIESWISCNGHETIDENNIDLSICRGEKKHERKQTSL